jgi:hypothetical protein
VLHFASRLEQCDALRIQRAQLAIHVEANGCRHVAANLKRVGFTAMNRLGGEYGRAAGGTRDGQCGKRRRGKR